MNTKLLINGELIETKDRQEVTNPSTGGVAAQVSIAGKKEIESALASARRAADEGDWPKIPLSERMGFLYKIAQGIQEHAAELAGLETLNTGKPIKESTFMDIPSSAKTFAYFAEHLEEYLQPENVTISAQTGDAESELLREPRGVAVLIVPWNYPLLIASWKMAQALAAGNTIVLKPSSLTPLTALELGRIVHDAGLPAGAVNILNSPGAASGELLCADGRVDMISFTGSNEVGRQIIHYSCANVKKLIMELGGKSASVIFEDADLETAVNSSLCSAFLNSGQMCTSMSRIYVQKSIYNKFLHEFVTRAQRIVLGKGEDFQTQLGPLISELQRNKVTEFVEKAKKEGAKLLCGGKAPDSKALRGGSFFEPTVFSGVTQKMEIFWQEVFGPVVCVSEFSDMDEAVSLANSTAFGLAACIWTPDAEKARSAASRIQAGTVWVNTYGMFYNEVPYGGFRQSGFGKELGKAGFLEYTRLKNVVVDSSKDAKPITHYWYGF